MSHYPCSCRSGGDFNTAAQRRESQQSKAAMLSRGDKDWALGLWDDESELSKEPEKRKLSTGITRETHRAPH